MRARVGDLAIVRFDPVNPIKNQFYEKVGIVLRTVTHKTKSGTTREHEFIYWEILGDKTEILTNTLPPHRLVRARPKRDDWEGTLHSLTRDNVVPVT